MTSTPLRGNKSRSIKEHFPKHDLSIIESTGSDSSSPANNSQNVIEAVKSVLSVSKELKKSQRENATLVQENRTLIGINESLRDENRSLREESMQFGSEEPVFNDKSNKENLRLIIPKLQLHDAKNSEGNSPQEAKQIKKEVQSFITNDEDRAEAEKKSMVGISKRPEHVYTATATIQVDTETIDANVQTENDDAVNVINANLKLEVDQLHSQKEIIEKKNTDLTNRLSDSEKLITKYEEEKKLRSDLEEKLKAQQDKLTQSETRVNELQLRLNKKKKEMDEVTAENRKLLEDMNTHDFELDELNVHMEHVEKQKKEVDDELERLKQNIKDLEVTLAEEKNVKSQLQSDIDNLKREHESQVKELNEKANQALSRESAALGQVATVKAENKEYVKESKYLTESRQVLIESESNLKNDVNVLTAKLRQKESQLTVFKEQVSESERHCEGLEAQIAKLEEQNKELNKNKYDSNELLEELKKGKREIDHLRQQLQMKATESDEINRLKEDLEQSASREARLKEKLEQAMKKEAESEVKLEELIRSEAAATTHLNRLKEENAEQKSTIDLIQQQSILKETAVLNLQKELDTRISEFEDFRTQADLQYTTEIFKRNQQIEELRIRLVELETYPGQTISVSRKTAGVQTDEVPNETELTAADPVVEEQAASPDVSLVSEEFIPKHLAQLEERLRGILLEMNKLVSHQYADHMASDASSAHIASSVFRKLSEFLYRVMNETEISLVDCEEDVNRLWSSLNEDIRRLTTSMEETMEEVKLESAKNLRMSVQRLEAENEKLRADLYELEEVAEQRLNCAEEFKNYCDIEAKEKEDAQMENARLQELHRELAESESLERSLRERLERAEHSIQRMAREKLQRTEEFETELEKMTSILQSTETDHNRKVAELKDDILSRDQKLAFDRKTMRKLVESSDAFKIHNDYLRKRNKQRQKLLIHMNAVVVKMHGLANSSESRREMVELTDHVRKTGLLHEDAEEAAIIHKTDRRIPSGVNGEK